MFDPTIYSMQPLQVNSTNNNNNNNNNTNTSNNNNINNNVAGDTEKVNLDDVSAKNGIATASDSITDDQSSIGQQLSRKTSTASECTTMSDYTPENTISSSTTSSPPTISMFQNALPIDPSPSELRKAEQGPIEVAHAAQSIENAVENALIASNQNATIFNQTPLDAQRIESHENVQSQTMTAKQHSTNDGDANAQLPASKVATG